MGRESSIDGSLVAETVYVLRQRGRQHIPARLTFKANGPWDVRFSCGFCNDPHGMAFT
jgi:hypothetical protein